jgi:hypothetical protein
VLNEFRQLGRGAWRQRIIWVGIDPKAVTVLPIQETFTNWSIAVTSKVLIIPTHLTILKL